MAVSVQLVEPSEEEEGRNQEEACPGDLGEEGRSLVAASGSQEGAVAYREGKDSVAVDRLKRWEEEGRRIDEAGLAYEGQTQRDPASERAA